MSSDKGGNNLVKRRALIYLLGVEWSNPNGDPSMDNAPRIYEDKVFTTDVFLKRRIRDYVYDKYGKKDEEEYLSNKDKSKKRNIIFFRRDIKESGEILTPEKRTKKLEIEYIDDAKNLCWDIRVFGALVPIKGKGGGKGEGWAIYGPVQFTFGTSIHPVDYIDVQITSVLAHSEGKAKGGSMGIKPIVPVTIIEYYGFVNDYTAEDTGMSEKDYEKLREGLLNLREAHSANTATKNIVPLALIEVEFKNNKYAYLKGLIETKEAPKTSIRESKIDLGKLIEKLGELGVEYIVYIKQEFKDIFENLPKEVKYF